jgi:large subunit ribosomal protein L17e
MILEAKGHFREFVDFIRLHGMEEEDLEVIAKLKSILWAVVSTLARVAIIVDGSPGSRRIDRRWNLLLGRRGRPPRHHSHRNALESSQSERVSNLAMQMCHSADSYRSTCFFALGLIACCQRGAELLETCHWVAAYTPIGVPTGYCLPEVVDSFLEVRIAAIRQEVNCKLTTCS